MSLRGDSRSTQSLEARTVAERRRPEAHGAGMTHGAGMNGNSAMAARLHDVGPGTALAFAMLLGFGGPKRLVLAILAMASVSDADLGAVVSVTLLVLYVAVATLLVSVPVGFVVVGGSRAVAVIGRGQAWLEANSGLLRVWVAIVLGGALIVDGLVRLF